MKFLVFIFIMLQTYGYCACEVALKKLDTHIQKHLKAKKIVGCAVAVVYADKIIFMKAYGLKNKSIPNAAVDLETVFQLGSISKPITATLVCILNKAGLLSLNDYVNPFHPELKLPTTVKHLLTHSSGFAKLGWNYKIEAKISRQELLAGLLNSPQQNPGDKFDYHNLAYSLIEDVLEETQQQTFKNIVTTKLFQPCHMVNATVGFKDFVKQDNKAWPHYQDKKHNLRPYKGYSTNYHNTAASAAGMNANIKDMAQFLLAQLNCLAGICDSADLEPFHTPVIAANDAALWFEGVFTCAIKSYYGIGWRIIETPDQRIIFHGSILNGFRNFLAFDKKSKIGIVILNNSDSGFAATTSLTFLSKWQQMGQSPKKSQEKTA